MEISCALHNLKLFINFYYDVYSLYDTDNVNYFPGNWTI